MALTPSNSFPIGKKAPDFSLMDTVSSSFKTLKELKGENGTAIFFICNHCPYVIHVNDTLIKIANDFQSKGIAFIAISSNDVGKYPQDGPVKMKEQAIQLSYPFPYLFDESQEVAKNYDAACTPDLYLFDSDLKAVYHGQLDDSRPGNDKPCDGADFINAINNLLADKSPVANQKPSIGCGIKWKI